MTDSPHKLSKQQAKEVKAFYAEHGLFWIQAPAQPIKKVEKKQGKAE